MHFWVFLNFHCFSDLVSFSFPVLRIDYSYLAEFVHEKKKKRLVHHSRIRGRLTFPGKKSEWIHASSSTVGSKYKRTRRLLNVLRSGRRFEYKSKQSLGMHSQKITVRYGEVPTSHAPFNLGFRNQHKCPNLTQVLILISRDADVTLCRFGGGHLPPGSMLSGPPMSHGTPLQSSANDWVPKTYLEKGTYTANILSKGYTCARSCTSKTKLEKGIYARRDTDEMPRM